MENAEVLLAPPDWPAFGEFLMSNFDHRVNQDVAQALRDGNVVADYPGMNFYARCWVGEDGRFYAAVKRYHVHVATFSAPTPEELMTAVSDEFGWD